MNSGELAAKIEAYPFSSEGGNLAMCQDWMKLKIQLALDESKAANLQSRISELEAKNAKLRATCDARQQELMAQVAQCSEFEAENAELREELGLAHKQSDKHFGKIVELSAKLRDITENYVVCEREPVGFYRHNPQNLEYGVKWNIEDTLPHGTKLYRPRQEPKEPK
jgi:hypothetical protein